MAEKYAEAAGINVLMKVPYNTEARDMDDSFDFAVRLPGIRRQFDRLAADILNDAVTPCEAKGLEFIDFVRLFGNVSSELPAAASPDELFSRNAGADAPGDGKSSSETVPNPEEILDSERQHMLKCIDRLAEAEREIYTLLEIEGKSPEQIADLKNLGLQEVNDRIAGARKTLRTLFFDL